MEKLLEEIVNSSITFLKFLKLLFTRGFYSILIQKDKNSYTVLTLSSLFFYLLGFILLPSDFSPSSNSIAEVYEILRNNFLENSIWNYLFKYFLLVVLFTEIYSRIFTRAATERAFLLRFCYVTITWFNLFCSIALVYVALLVLYSRLTLTVLDEGFIFFPAILLLLIYFSIPINSLRNAKKNKIIGLFSLIKGILVPLLLLFALKILFTDVLKPIKTNSIFFLNPKKQVMTLQTQGSDSVLFKTSFIYENEDKSNYLLDTSKAIFFFGWTSSLFGKSQPQFSDTIEMLTDKGFNDIALKTNIPILITLYANADTSQRNSFQGKINSKAFMPDRDFFETVLYMKTINKGNILLSKERF